jgi:hypothetical protein
MSRFILLTPIAGGPITKRAIGGPQSPAGRSKTAASS